jgi:phage-related protein
MSPGSSLQGSCTQLKKLPRHQVAALEDLIRRHGSNQLRPRESEHVNERLKALRTTVDGSEIRLYYANVDVEDPICLALSVLNKKSGKIPKHEIRKAEARLRDWLSRHKPDSQVLRAPQQQPEASKRPRSRKAKYRRRRT